MFLVGQSGLWLDCRLTVRSNIIQGRSGRPWHMPAWSCNRKSPYSWPVQVATGWTAKAAGICALGPVKIKCDNLYRKVDSGRRCGGFDVINF